MRQLQKSMVMLWWYSVLSSPNTNTNVRKRDLESTTVERAQALSHTAFKSTAGQTSYRFNFDFLDRHSHSPPRHQYIIPAVGSWKLTFQKLRHHDSVSLSLWSVRQLRCKDFILYLRWTYANNTRQKFQVQLGTTHTHSFCYPADSGSPSGQRACL